MKTTEPFEVIDSYESQTGEKAETKHKTAIARRDIGREILEGTRELKRGEAGRITTVPRRTPQGLDDRGSA